MLAVFRTIYGMLAVVKTLHLMASGSASLTDGISLSSGVFVAIPVGVVMLIAEVFFIRGRAIRAASLIMMAGFLTFIFVLDLYNHHTYLLAAIAAIFAIGAHVTLMLKIQMSVVYFYAAITKINEAYLSGTELYAFVVQLPLWNILVGVDPNPWFLIGMAGLSILVEGFLAFGFWFRRTRWIALVIGVGFHIALVVSMTQGVHPSGINLSIYGLTLITFYTVFFPQHTERLFRRFLRADDRRYSIA